jgi:hypothetical protein
VWNLSDRNLGWFATVGVRGLGAAPVSYTVSEKDRGGISIDSAWTPPRQMTLPLFVEGANHTQFTDRFRALGGAFTMTKYRGPGQLIILRPDGTSRMIDAVYQDGYEGDPLLGRRNDLMALTLLCPQAYWRSPTPQPIQRGVFADAGGSFLSPFLRISSSQKTGATTAFNPGDVPAWPSWRVTGPFDSLVATSLTLDQSWTLDVLGSQGAPLGVGEVVTITTNPETVTGPDGTPWPEAINWSGNSELWPLDQGVNQISFVFDGSGAGTLIEGEFDILHEMA